MREENPRIGEAGLRIETAGQNAIVISPSARDINRKIALADSEIAGQTK